MTEKILRRLFPFTIRMIELKARLDSQEEFAQNIIDGKNTIIYELPDKRYKLGVIESS